MLITQKISDLNLLQKEIEAQISNFFEEEKNIQHIASETITKSQQIMEKNLNQL